MHLIEIFCNSSMPHTQTSHLANGRTKPLTFIINLSESYSIYRPGSKYVWPNTGYYLLPRDIKLVLIDKLYSGGLSKFILVLTYY